MGRLLVENVALCKRAARKLREWQDECARWRHDVIATAASPAHHMA